MARPLLGLWLTIVLPFIGVTAIGGPAGDVVNHLLLHLILIVLAGLSFWPITGLRRATTVRTIRVTAVALAVVQVLFVIGNIGEAIATFGHGGFAAGHDVFDDPVHDFFSYITPSSFLLAVAGVVVLSIEVFVVSLRAQAQA